MTTFSAGCDGSVRMWNPSQGPTSVQVIGKHDQPVRWEHIIRIRIQWSNWHWYPTIKLRMWHFWKRIVIIYPLLQIVHYSPICHELIFPHQLWLRILLPSFYVMINPFVPADKNEQNLHLSKKITDVTHAYLSLFSLHPLQIVRNMKFLPTHNVLVTSSWDKSVIWVQNLYLIFINFFHMYCWICHSPWIVYEFYAPHCSFY